MLYIIPGLLFACADICQGQIKRKTKKIILIFIRLLLHIFIFWPYRSLPTRHQQSTKETKAQGQITVCLTSMCAPNTHRMWLTIYRPFLKETARDKGPHLISSKGNEAETEGLIIRVTKRMRLILTQYISPGILHSMHARGSSPDRTNISQNIGFDHQDRYTRVTTDREYWNWDERRQ